jgi:hypothetical protein
MADLAPETAESPASLETVLGREGGARPCTNENVWYEVIPALSVDPYSSDKLWTHADRNILGETSLLLVVHVQFVLLTSRRG